MATLFEMLKTTPRAAGDVSGVARGVASLLGTSGVQSEEDRVLRDNEFRREAEATLRGKGRRKDEILSKVDINDPASLLAAAEAMRGVDTAESAALLTRYDQLISQQKSAQQEQGAVEQRGAFKQFIQSRHPDLLGVPPQEALKIIQQREKDAAAGGRSAAGDVAAGERNDASIAGRAAATPAAAKAATGDNVTQAEIDVVSNSVAVALEGAGSELTGVPFFKSIDDNLVQEVSQNVVNLQKQMPPSTPIQQIIDIAVQQATSAQSPADEATDAGDIEAVGARERKAIAAGWVKQTDGTWLNPSTGQRGSF